MDERMQQLLRELRRALSDAITESDDVSRALRRLRDEGYSLYLSVDLKRDREDVPQLVAAGERGHLTEPVFQIDGRDLNFLRSIGIDPTRRLRRRRTV